MPFFCAYGARYEGCPPEVVWGAWRDLVRECVKSRVSRSLSGETSSEADERIKSVRPQLPQGRFFQAASASEYRPILHCVLILDRKTGLLRRVLLTTCARSETGRRIREEPALRVIPPHATGTALA